MLNEPSNYAEFVDAVSRLLDVKERSAMDFLI